MELFHGLSNVTFNENHKIIYYSTFVSTSLDKEVAEQFMKQNEAKCSIIHIKFDPST